MQNIQNIIDGKKTGTRFIADKRMVAKKRWIFDKKDFSNSWIMVDEGLGSVIRGGQPASLLTVGIQGVGGDFKENDVIAIKDRQGIIGYGEVRYDVRNAKKLINNKESKILIHYDQYVRTI
jgi:glutamate 5-kinase